ncbi:heavy-metal-associated domain-containing protein [Flavobacterium psychrotolerans]|uniref:Metal transporter n=1 Tax=Flavobacterium psychrotolerans TaxID=2169410 RepID=A0A2U1JP53_9FLAO|nr:metal transporter [Flavobacterium psychrotolerans]PWA06608.1 metal transporter [Flavobacterium psychrotolerans]
MKLKTHEPQKNNRKVLGKNIIITLLMTFLGFATQAQDLNSIPKKNKNAKYTIEVNGNCEQCQKRIQKAAYSVSGVKSALWSIETHQLSLVINEEKCTVLDVKKAIAKVGHDTDEVKATNEDYEKLHSCCLYERN